MKTFLWVPLGLAILLSGCSPDLKEAVSLDSSGPFLNLRTWDFVSDGPVRPQGWAWDPDVLWSPSDGGRPDTLPAPLARGPLDRGGTLIDSLKRPFPLIGAPPLASATARLMVLVAPGRDVGLQIGAFPGAIRVWVNGVLVWEQGVLSTNPVVYRAAGGGTVLTVQPREGLLDIVVDLVSSDPIVRHSELNRRWVIGSAETMLSSYRAENNWRSLQAAVLLMGIIVFLWVVTLRTERRPLLWFVGFLAACLVKLYANVEQPEPLFDMIFPRLSLSVWLFLNHGFNVLPFPIFLWFLKRQFPGIISMRASMVFLVATGAVVLWELLPFVVLAFGWVDVYIGILQPPWYFLLNLYVVVSTLYLFERLYQIFTKKLPLSRALFLGGLFMGLIILLPIPLSYFITVKYTYFLGWGMFLFLGLMTLEVVQLQIRTDAQELSDLRGELGRQAILGRFLETEWAPRLGRDALHALKPGDTRAADSVVVQVRSQDDPERWLPLLGLVALNRKALLVDWRDGTATWVLNSWSETALAFALEAQRTLLAIPGLVFHVLLAKSVIKYRLLNLESHWRPLATELPLARLEDLFHKAERNGACVVLDGSLRDGLAVGGWRRHRSLSIAGTEIELYEADEETVASLKDKTLDSYESALGFARESNWDSAVQTLFSVVQENPFDQAARTLLSEWGTLRRS